MSAIDERVAQVEGQNAVLQEKASEGARERTDMRADIKCILSKIGGLEVAVGKLEVRVAMIAGGAILLAEVVKWAVGALGKVG